MSTKTTPLRWSKRRRFRSRSRSLSPASFYCSSHRVTEQNSIHISSNSKFNLLIHTPKNTKRKPLFFCCFLCICFWKILSSNGFWEAQERKCGVFIWKRKRVILLCLKAMWILLQILKKKNKSDVNTMGSQVYKNRLSRKLWSEGNWIGFLFVWNKNFGFFGSQFFRFVSKWSLIFLKY